MVPISAVYYPNFEPPADWLRAFLLVFDQITTMVPEDVRWTPSPALSELLDSIPTALDRVSPTESDVEPDVATFDVLRQAFLLIRDRTPEIQHDRVSISVQFNPDGTLEVPGHVFLHERKLSAGVRSLLTDLQLLRPELESMLGSVVERPADFAVVSRPAADLIVSLVADQMARRFGWNTVTDQHLDFSLNAVIALKSGAPSGREVALVSSVLNCVIPSQIAELPIERYREIRESYSGVRHEIARVLIEMSRLYGLDSPGDPEILRRRLRDVTEELEREIERLRRSAAVRTIRQWVPICVGGLASVVGAWFQQPHIAVSAAGVGVATQFIQGMAHREDDSERTRILRLLGRMQRDVMNAAELQWLM